MNLWKCPTCKREFKNKNQVHSCAYYPLENHFKNKPYGEKLFDELKKKIEKNIGPLKIESLPCCIHLMSDYTFSGVWALKNSIKIDFCSRKEIKSNRIIKEYKASNERYINYLEIKNRKEIDKELLGWIKDAYFAS